MSFEEILINVTPQETRVAIIDQGILQECHIERVNKKGKVSNIYQGKVIRILPGMQAAFVDIGLNKAVFLHASDIYYPTDNPDSSQEIKSIEKLITHNQTICVQVFKDEISTKGARVTTRLSLPSRYLVYLPYDTDIGVSLRIEEEVERDRLKKILETQQAKGFIIRTAAEGVEESVLLEEKKYLEKLWQEVSEDIKKAKVGQLIYEDCSLLLRSIRDLSNVQTKSIKIDSLEGFKKAQAFAQKFVPALVPKIELYMGKRSLFDLYQTEEEIQKALDKKVLLKSGGYLVIDQTEALTTIDINTGAFVGTKNLEETIFKTNLEAAGQIARQLRLRNIGGIIIIDFIDMEKEEHKSQVMSELEKSMSVTASKYKIGSFSPLGLVEMSRKRIRESLKQQLCEDCHVCSGKGSVKSTETICLEIYREIIKAHQAFCANGYLVLCHEAIVNRMLEEETVLLESLEILVGRPIKFQVEQLYQQENYDVVLR
jgi:ribonuclease G